MRARSADDAAGAEPGSVRLPGCRSRPAAAPARLAHCALAAGDEFYRLPRPERVVAVMGRPQLNRGDDREATMRKIVAGLAMTLDGVVEAPSQRNWMRYNDEMGAVIGAGIAQADAILLGRRTYLEFAALWPALGSDVPMAEFMNNTPKYVVSSTLHTLDWANSILVTGDLAEEAAKLKARPGKNIQVPGSPRVVRSLLRAGLLDELGLMIHPIVLGSGMRLFEEMTGQIRLELAGSTTLSTGVVSVTYTPARA